MYLPHLRYQPEISNQMLQSNSSLFLPLLPFTFSDDPREGAVSSSESQSLKCQPLWHVTLLRELGQEGKAWIS